MSWEERLQTAAYTSPSGNRFEFIYGNVSVEVDKKTSTFTFPEKEGAYIQDLGRAGRRYPFTLFFSGADYDIVADNFLLALEEKGVGLLEHPKYGNRNVVPTGTITRNDNLVTEANQASFSFSFSETLEEITFPTSETSETDEINQTADDFQSQTAEQFTEAVQIDNASEGVVLETIAADSVSTISDPLEDLASLEDVINSAFETVKAVYENNVENILSNASLVVTQAIALIRIPGQAAVKASDKETAYSSLINSVIGLIQEPDGSNNPVNKFLYDYIIASGALSSLCEGLLNSLFTTRVEAVEAAENILDLYDDITEWQDASIESLDFIDTGESYEQLLKIVSSVSAYLINTSFSLPGETIETIVDDRNVIEFIASRGLSVENDLDNFIQWNNLTADEIEILPAGMQVVWYA